MRTFELSGVSDHALLDGLSKLVQRDRATMADLLAHIAEVDARKLFAAAGYDSMFEYCVGKLHLSEDSAYRRITAGRTARRYPAIFASVADGRLHLSAVNLLAANLTDENAAELIEAAAGKRKREIELLLAQRFPKPDVKPMIRALPQRKPERQLVPGRVELNAAKVDAGQTGGMPLAARPAKIKPLAPKRYAIQATVDQATHDKLRHAQALLSHKLPSGDIAHVLGLALEALVEKLEKQKFAANRKPRASARRAAAKRTIPARVKRAVWARDGGQCTFVGTDGHRCQSRKFLEFDHADPVARDGTAQVTTVRLRCRTHNQLEAERVFGAEFMAFKRDDAHRGMM